jgi:hypothetical protein
MKKGERERKKKNSTQINQEKNNKTIEISKYLSIISLNINDLKSPTKSHSLANRIEKQDPTICCLQKAYLAKM